MQYIKIDEDKYIELDDTTNKSNIIFKSELENELESLQIQIDALPPMPSDEELLYWAKLNYTNEDSRNRTNLQSAIDDLTNKLSLLDDSNQNLMSLGKVSDGVQNPKL